MVKLKVCKFANKPHLFILMCSEGREKHMLSEWQNKCFLYACFIYFIS